MHKSLLFSLSMIGQIGFATALPLVIFSKLGEYIDNRFGTEPYGFYGGILIATIQIFWYIGMIAKRAAKEFDQLTNDK